MHCVISLFFTPDIYRDVARCYAWYAREFGRGVWHDVPISFLPPLTIFLAGNLVSLGLEAYAAVKLVSLFFFVLTLLPLYRLLKYLGEGKAACWGCLLFIAAPRLLRYSGMALLEPVRDFFLVSAVCLLVKGWKKGIKLTDSLLLGVSLGFMSLARSEGIMLAFFLLCARCYLPEGNRTMKSFLKSLLPAGIMMAVVLLPAAIHNCRLTGYPVLDQRMNGVLANCPGLGKLFKAKEFAFENLVKTGQLRIDDEAPGKEEEDKAENALERLEVLPQKIFRGGYELYICAAALGVLVLILRGEWKKEHSFLLGYCLVTPLPFIFFSVSSRYFLYFIPLLMV
ncbi:MAG: glycosyltransferase family 39 protein, partial [Lentisphaeria bacterium]|nr:glycosyltransferase family 39 protein [Lentisphaeria bacterium]